MTLDDALIYQPPLISPRSVLFSLPPSGVGTPHQESLLSLLVRTSRAHGVSPRLLIKEVFGSADAAFSKLGYSGFFRVNAGTINGLGRYAEMFVSATEKLTAHQHLRHLTLLPWQGLFPFNGQGLLARQPRWCPACLHQQHILGQDVIFPLRWNIEVSRSCTEHMCRLEDHCPYCGKTQPYIPRFPDMGICDHCHRSLAGIRPREETSQFQLWANNAIGDMLMRQSDSSFAPSVECFRDFVRERVQSMADGNRAVFCRAVGFNDMGLTGWLTKGERPSPSQFLALCYGVNIMPTDVFTDTPRPAEEAGFRLLPEKLKERKDRPLPSPQRRKEWEDLLNGQLIAEESQSVTMIAANLGVRQTCLQYWFPELCRSLSERHKAAIKIRSEKHQAQQSQRVEEVVKIILTEGRYPSQRQVDYILKDEGMSLAQPHLLQAYMKALEDLSLYTNDVLPNSQKTI
jgi:hypothetical protein